ncbi:hypothetical protein CXB51_026104 [Gossypium anomalum]|uniref:Reverse transcriptase Ty1/copia-type domain-containing protein n=1 Tax=Gossypium anomalum TaxID=47600 RepID=A0A8J5Y2K0_9ROSI|nr:hypothetical protein CXB51_026104 [Gossypium anomalum]
MKDLFVKALYLPVFAAQKPDLKSDEEWEFKHQQTLERPFGSHSLILPHKTEVLVIENRGRNRDKDGKGRDKAKVSQDRDTRILSAIIVNDDKKSQRVAIVTCEDLLVICDENLVNLVCDETSWVIDTGASLYVTSRKNFFTSYTPGDFEVLKMGNDGLVSVIGKLVMRDSVTPSNATLNNYAHCLPRKQRRVSFRSRPLNRRSELLELVHLYVCGPIKFQASVEREIGKKLKCIRTDNGGEYTGLYDLVQKKLVRSRDFVFIEDQTIDDIDKTEKVDIGDFDTPMDDVVNDQQQAPIAPPAVPLRRSSRDRRSSVRAIESEHKDQWVEAMKDKLQSLHENHTFELIGRQGLYSEKGVDFEEIFSPVVKKSSIRTILSLVACYDLEVEQMDVKLLFFMVQMDVKTTFLHGDLEEELYMEQPEGFVAQGKEDSVCRLKRACMRFSGDDFIILLLYVDDMLIVGQNASRIEKLKQELSKSFAMKDLGPAKQILGIRLTRDRKAKKLWLSQERYIEKVLQRFSIDKAKAMNTPFATHFRLSVKHSPSRKKEKEEMQKIPYSSAVGSLMYTMIMRYLRGTSNMKLCFDNDKPVLVGYTDSDMAGDIDSRRSTSGYLITYVGGAVARQSRLQKCVALSTTESEFIAATEACKKMLWMKKFVNELGFTQEKYFLYCDSQSAIHLGKNSNFHARSKHIDVRYHWIRDVFEAKLLELQKIHTNDNGADMLTKALPRGKFETCCLTSGMEAFPT